MGYALTAHADTVRRDDGTFIPRGNRLWSQYEAWCAAGGVPTPYVAPQDVPVVSRFQARAALHLAGLLDQVEALMSDPGTDMLARLAWQDAQEFRRDSPTVVAMAAALGLADAQVDALFSTAQGIIA